MKVFIDTGAWLALEIKNDVNHRDARKFVDFIKKRRALLFTNTLVLSETYTRLIYDVSLTAAKKFHEKIIEGTRKNLTIFDVDLSIDETVWNQLQRYGDHRFSYTDATVIVHFKKFILDTI